MPRKFLLIATVFLIPILLMIGCGAGSVHTSSTTSPTQLTITTTSLANGTAGTAYSTILAATGGQVPYTWSVASGALPGGLSLSSTGVLSGTPTASGSFTFTAAVADSSSTKQTASQSLTLVIQAATSSSLTITTTSLPSGTVGTGYSATLAATGGQTPYSWSVSSGTLPSGLTLSSAGVLSGIPTASGSFNFTISVADSSSTKQTASQSFTLAVQSTTSSSLSITTTSLSAGTVGKSYSSTLAATGGQTPYSWSVTSGALPGGLALSTAGVLSGTPTQSGSYTFTISVNDSSSTPQTAARVFTLVVQGSTSQSLTITSTSVPNGTVGTTYSVTLTATGGQTPYKWSVTAGTLPAGLTLSTAGVISGMPTTSVSSTFTVVVTDSSATPQTASKSFTLSVQSSSSLALTITSTSLPAGRDSSSYSTALAATGGQVPYTWSISSGTLPTGITLSTAGVLSGTPTQSGIFTFTVAVTDSSTTQQKATANFSLQINAATTTTWYVRPDGGTRYSAAKTTGQCNGKADAAYPGSGTNQNCAFNDFRYLYTDGTNKEWVIAGGDTVIVRGGPWRIGVNSNPVGDFGNNLGYYYLAYNPPIPSGTAQQHTRILGENYATCSTSPKTQLFGGWGVYADLYLVGAQYVDVQCFELTDHAQCSNCNASSDDFAKNGLMTDVTTHDVWLQDLDIHGFSDNGIKGMIGGPVNVTNMRIADNPLAGWEFDDGSGQSSTAAAVNATKLSIEWNGCNEEYPITHNYPAIGCADDNSGGYGDGVGTPNTPLNFTCDQCLFRYNTQDGLDLYHVTGSNITITNSVSYGNMGQQFKTGPMQSIVFQNNLAVTNCNRLSKPIGDISSTFNANLGDFCRANGDGIQMALLNGGTLDFENNSIAGYSNVTLDFQCDSSSCSSSKLIFRNNLVLGYSDPSYNNGQLPAFYYFSSGLTFTQRDHNLIYNQMKNSANDCGSYASEVCTDPLLVSEPVSMSNETTLDNFNFNLSSGSPARNAGIAIQGLTTDYTGATRPNPPSIGAYEFH